MLGALASCGGNKKTATINVINGTGGGTFNIGESVTITATIPEDRSFDFWALNGNNVSTDNPYTFTVTEDATFTAFIRKAKKHNY